MFNLVLKFVRLQPVASIVTNFSSSKLTNFCLYAAKILLKLNPKTLKKRCMEIFYFSVHGTWFSLYYEGWLKSNEKKI